MNQTDLVLMPGADYQKICDHLREVYNVDYPIISSDAEGMVGSFKDLLREERMDWLIADNKNLDEYTNDRITKVRLRAFSGMSAGPKIVKLPNVTTVGMWAFQMNSRVEEVYLPNATMVSSGAFNPASNLRIADLGSVSTIQSMLFNSASTLNTVFLRRTGDIANLSSTDAFDYTPYAKSGTGGKIYVPEALIEKYKTATNWSVLYGYGKCEFVAIEGSEYE